MNSTCELGDDTARALKPYPAYKDSGVEWLGDVPAHWEVLRLKQICRLAYGDALADAVRRDGAVPVLGSNGRVGFHDSANTKAPCIVIGRKGSFGKVNYSPDPAFAIDTTFFVDSRFSSANIRWLFFLLRWLRLDEVTRDSAVPGLDREDTYQRPGVLPPLSEQAAIVRFLDHADRRIRRYIRAKQKLIALLKEQKQAIIHQAVTGQIDIRTGKPYPVYKDSRVEWLGRIPQRWRAVSLGRLTLDRCDGPFGSGLKSSHYTDEGIRVVRLQNIGHGTFNDEDAVYIAPEHYATLGDHSVQPGDLLIAGLGDPHHPAGRACVAPTNIRPAMVKADCFRFRVDQEAFLPAFAALQLTATAHAASAVLSTGATRQRTNLQSTTGRHVVVPSKSEQARVVEYCTGEKARLDAVQQAAGREILLLGAYRTRLIADVVTGKLDVREAATRLPDEVEELEPLDEADALIDGEEEPTAALATAP